MTYEQAYQWAIDNIPMYQFDSFEEWKAELFGNTRLESLGDSSTFNRMIERAWENEFGSLETRRPIRRSRTVIDEGVFP